MPALDDWLVTAFVGDGLEKVLTRLTQAEASEPSNAITDNARQLMAGCDRRLAQYRKALDSGADPVVVAGWMADVEVEKRKAYALLGKDHAKKPAMSVDAIRDAIKSIVDVAAPLRTNSNREAKAKVYSELGITLRYEPDKAKVLLEARPELAYSACVGERN